MRLSGRSGRPRVLALAFALTGGPIACGASRSEPPDDTGAPNAGGASTGGTSGNVAGGSGGTTGGVSGTSGANALGGAGTSSAGGVSGTSGARALGGTGPSGAGGVSGAPSAGDNAGASGAGGNAGASGVGGNAGAPGPGGSAGAGGSGVVFPAGCKCMDLGPPACAPTGHLTYTLAKAANPTSAQQSAYDAITCAMDGAVAYYNCNTSITKQLNVSYVPSVNTADGNFNGSIRFGNTSDMQCVTAMHEIAHTVGVGTASNWGTYSVNGLFTGMNAIAELRSITGNGTDVLHSDTQHFWPYGLNYVTEAHSTADLIDHCRRVTAIRKDLGLK